ncbi:MAG: BspA family leucine-rich repeat surface protein, partial [Oscillospiraceae bacterium]|nr:BspA family leucine-rich repeat surface protein [Oscillospiraceae bacterium]
MRKISFTLLAILIFALTMTIPAFAEEAGITLEIPSKVSISGTEQTGTIRLYGTMPVNKTASVSIGSDEGFILRSVLNPNSAVPYDIYCNGKALRSGNVIMTGRASELAAGKISTLGFKLSGNPNTSGTFKDIITFTLSLADNPLSSVAVTRQPNKTEYTAGENFDPTGMVVTAYYADGSSREITGYSIAGGSNLSPNSTSVTVSYTENGVTKTANVAVTVKSVIPKMGNFASWYKSSYGLENIQTVSFMDSYTPTGAEDESWDGSFSQDGGVMCYRSGNHVIVSGNGSGYIKTGNYSSSMFANFKALTTINGMTLLDTSDAVSMNSMFLYCSNLTSVDLSSFDTSKVTDMTYMFYLCNKLGEIKGLGNLNTSNVTNMLGMFSFCYPLETLDIGGFDTGKVTNMMYLFVGNRNLKSLPIANWNTASLQNMQEMFTGCEQLTGLDISRWNTSKVTNMMGAFSGCKSLTSMSLRGLDVSNVTTMRRLFLNCPSIQSIDIGGLNTSKVTDMSEMFQTCIQLREIDVSGIDTSKVTNMGHMFENCPELTTIYANDS